MVLNKKSQSFSTDIIIVVVIILFGTLFVIVSQINSIEQGPALEEKYAKANLQSEMIVQNLRQKDIISNQNQVDVNRLLLLSEDQIREELNIDSDFAIVFEKGGRLVRIDPENNINCIGSQNIIINGVPCR